MFKRFVDIIVLITKQAFYEAVYFAQVNVRYIVVAGELALPYCMYALGQRLVIVRGGIDVGGEIFIPILSLILLYYTKELANKTGKGNTVPIPRKRFTEVDDDGEVSVENRRLQELLLYVADLEDYLERKGLL